MINNINPLDNIKELKEQGFTEDYVFEDGKLRNISTNQKYSSNDVKIVNEYRFEGQSNPSDMSILYALKTSNGEKGQIMVSYSPVVDNSELNDFMMATENSEAKKA